MKVKSINVQISKCPRQYEAVRLGMECEIFDGENEQDAIKACHDELLQIYLDLYPAKKSNTQSAQEKPAQENPAQEKPAQAAVNPATVESAKPKPEEREPLKFGDKRVQAVVRRIEKTPERAEEILKQALQYYNPDEETMRVWNLAVTLNKQH